MNFQVPKLNTSCCGCTLRTGSLIIGYFHLVVYSIALIIPVIIFFQKLEKSIEELTFLENSLFQLNLISGVTLSTFFLFGCHKNNPSYILPFLIFQLAIFSVEIIRFFILIFLHILGDHVMDLLVLSTNLVFQAYISIIIYNHYINLRQGIEI